MASSALSVGSYLSSDEGLINGAPCSINLSIDFRSLFSMADISASKLCEAVCLPEPTAAELDDELVDALEVIHAEPDDGTLTLTSSTFDASPPALLSIGSVAGGCFSSAALFVLEDAMNIPLAFDGGGVMINGLEA